MTTKRNAEGWLYCDNRLSGGALIEAATITCSHCQRQLIRNPSRTRDRAWCSECDRYICDQCNAIRLVAGCKTFKQIVDERDRLIHRIGTT